MEWLYRAESWPLPLYEQKFIHADMEDDCYMAGEEVVGGCFPPRSCQALGDVHANDSSRGAESSRCKGTSIETLILRFQADKAKYLLPCYDGDDERGIWPIAPAEATSTKVAQRFDKYYQASVQRALKGYFLPSPFGLPAHQSNVIGTKDAKPRPIGDGVRACNEECFPQNSCGCDKSRLLSDVLLANDVPAAPAPPSESTGLSEADAMALPDRASTSVPTQIEADAISLPLTVMTAAAQSSVAQSSVGRPGEFASRGMTEDTEDEDGGADISAAAAADEDGATNSATADVAATVLPVKRESSGCYPMLAPAMAMTTAAAAITSWLAQSHSAVTAMVEDEASEALEAEGGHGVLGTTSTSARTVGGDLEGRPRGCVVEALPAEGSRRPRGLGRGRPSVSAAAAGSIQLEPPPCKRARRTAAAVLRTVIEEQTTDEEVDGEMEEEQYSEAAAEEVDDEEFVVRATGGTKRSRTGPSQGRTGGRLVSGSVCVDCGTDKTPQWRRGPKGPRTLCNACGVRFKKIQDGQALRGASGRARR
ncbi:hypothetical protein VOLCADRAFT_85916 [Volvox carteri f. nagariensis]|uniref:GATA-type domain-containing protein n=1 Tax=Volvox carteri f. nagariensis TaxID=3068 RepID=D8THC2_VOLCA|nr:uncharacterized protein VOLCADRAFT_85916 [Volvox carteri f. nagariensis]EFJ52685.1 hypothetical protein VOLCADRAFT_85916 [Volvox carteri f. nagariensis]|eukprot:XP_002945690.1 hypothetical protein VOLCADRAFT_85916 [Volvox carteri f. nagariensis]